MSRVNTSLGEIELVQILGFLQDHTSAFGGSQFRFNQTMLRRFRQYYDKDFIDPEDVIRAELRATEEGGYRTPHVIIGAEKTYAHGKELRAAASGNLLQPVKFSRSRFGILSYSPPDNLAGTEFPTYHAVEALKATLHALAKQRRSNYFGTIVEAEPGKVEVYRSWGFNVLTNSRGRNLDYVQPPLDWTRAGNPKKQERRLTLMMQMESSGVSEDRLSEQRIKGMGRALFDWYMPEADDFHPKAYQRITDRMMALEERFEDSLTETLLLR